MITKSIWVREALIKIDVYNSLPADRQQAITALVTEFNTLGYIDARTEIGPDQWARMSEKRRNEIATTANKVFAIECKIKLLMRSDAQIVAEQAKEQAQKLAERVRYLQHRKRTIEDFCTRRLNSNRNNTTKQEHQQIVAELAKLQPAS